MSTTCDHCGNTVPNEFCGPDDAGRMICDTCAHAQLVLQHERSCTCTHMCECGHP